VHAATTSADRREATQPREFVDWPSA
jgi:hypothetical protein